MKRSVRLFAALMACLFVAQCPASLKAFYAGLENAAGETIFSQDFIREYNAAETAADAAGSAEPFLKLLAKSERADERAELEVTLGVVYAQRGGLVDPAKAVEYLTKALSYRLPEETYLKLVLWRAGSLEQLGKLDEARRDHMRGLLACANYALPAKWPEILQPKNPAAISIGDVDPVNVERRRDFERYRKSVNFQQSVLMLRYYFVDGARRIGTKVKLDSEQLQQELEDLTPDTAKRAEVAKLIAVGLEKPWP